MRNQINIQLQILFKLKITNRQRYTAQTKNVIIDVNRVIISLQPQINFIDFVTVSDKKQCHA